MKKRRKRKRKEENLTNQQRIGNFGPAVGQLGDLASIVLLLHLAGYISSIAY